MNFLTILLLGYAVGKLDNKYGAEYGYKFGVATRDFLLNESTEVRE